MNQTFKLEIGESYKIVPRDPKDQKEGTIYLSSIATLIAIYANGEAEFRGQNLNTFKINLSENRIFGY